MSTRRNLLAASAAAGVAAVVAPQAAAAAKPGKQRTGFVYDARAVKGWDTGTPGGIFPSDPASTIFPGRHYENADTKQNVFDLLEAVGLTRQLQRIEARRATRAELLRVHAAGHVDNVNAISARERGGYGDPEKTTPIGHNGHILAELAFGGAIELAMAVWERQVKNGYMLMRPPGHHATRSQAMGFCTYNNLAGAAAALLAKGAKRILVLDWDVHTGNGTQDIFKDDPRVAIVDMHQRECFPPGAGHIGDRGVKNILNLDLLPGTGHATALYAVEKVIEPAIRRFNPEIILVASGFDSGITDPLARFMFGPATYREMTKRLMAAANNGTCKDRIAMFHEGGYDANAAPEYGLAVVEQLSGINTGRPSALDAVSVWQNAGNTPEVLALHRKMVDEVAALVPQIPLH